MIYTYMYKHWHQEMLNSTDKNNVKQILCEDSLVSQRLVQDVVQYLVVQADHLFRQAG
jgi:hypothetical protein